jgi:hypothetical protein
VPQLGAGVIDGCLACLHAREQVFQSCFVHGGFFSAGPGCVARESCRTARTCYRVRR